MEILSTILIVTTIYLNIKHGWGGVTNTMKPEEAKMISDLGINKTMLLVISSLTLLVVVLILFPQTFFVANLVNAAIILLIMALALKTGNIKTALIEIPFLLIPLVLIYLGHPLQKGMAN